MSGGGPGGTPGGGARRSLRDSVFGRVALVLVAVQVVTGAAAVGAAAWFAHARSIELAAGSLRVQLDRLAGEIEARAAPFEADLAALPRPVRLDLEARFPDPVIVVDADGRPRYATAGADTAAIPPRLPDLLAAGDVFVQTEEGAASSSFGVAPLYDPDGFLIGGVLVQPLDASVEREFEGTRTAYRRALVFVLLFAGATAVLLAVVVTGRLVAPLRRVTERVERIEAGDYATRLPVASGDEFGRLAGAVNRMAAEVEANFGALRETDALRRELIANVGHDLRTPLAALNGYVEEARRYLAESRPGDVDAALAAATGRGAYLERLVADLFELSVLDTARPPLRRAPVPTAELLHDVAAGHRRSFEAAGVLFDVDVSPGLPIVDVDAVRLLRLFDNLLGNALRHTSAGDAVRLSAAADDGVLTVEVADTGPGMAPEVAARVFDRHYRGTDARTRRSDGTGLGLAIARAVARAHGGDLALRTRPGDGAVFTLRLPIDPGTDSPAPEHGP